MREIAAIAKRHGAVSMRAGRCIAGPYTGQVVSAITFPDGAGFGRALDSMLADPEYQRFVAEVVKDSDLPSGGRTLHRAARSRSIGRGRRLTSGAPPGPRTAGR